jgi:hypothetical protein
MFFSQLGTKSVIQLSNLVYLRNTRYVVYTDESMMLLSTIIIMLT